MKKAFIVLITLSVIFLLLSCDESNIDDSSFHFTLQKNLFTGTVYSPDKSSYVVCLEKDPN